MRFPIYLKKKLLLILINRTVIFFFLMCLLTLLLYVAGTIQGFTDSTQLALLRLYVVLGIILTIASVCGVILVLRRFIAIRRSRYLLRAGGYLLLVVFGTLTVLAFMFVIAVSKGNL